MSNSWANTRLLPGFNLLCRHGPSGISVVAQTDMAVPSWCYTGYSIGRSRYHA